MVFNLNGKIALISGGASGIGLNFAKELLKNGVKGVCLADVSPEFGDEALKDIEAKFGTNRAIFVQTDVTDIKQFQNAFEKTIETFKYIDILINNAGIMNDSLWEKEISINLNGTIHGTLLALEKYLPNYKQGEDALIVNMSSVAGIAEFGFIPIYTATKHAIIGLTRAWGIPLVYERTKVRVVALCPGGTLTPLTTDMNGRNLGKEYETILEKTRHTFQPPQEPEYVAEEAMNVLKHGPNGTLWVIESGQPAYEFKFPERFAQKGNVLSYD
ncbi:unnamed protein product [Phaedon cochleariae]|uniref:15-hydroxyprostaglandin dehydrogenase [NAD(+)]-like n=1 Tax=Phaedon cochleariae TaxID=80249 RepID=A0A9N9S8V2_PHACE|nr:unnamed protein product [Phaedon cochleariae]